ncbi:MAG: ABC transporter permease subunit [Magnetococcales bacterium]|nr:ABC transporter permease subunit [Magnetococcales bacterium]
MTGLEFGAIQGALPILAQGAWITARITVTAVLVGVVLGTLLAIARLSPIKPLAWMAGLYVNLLRSVPLVMVILWFFLIVPQLLHALFGSRVADIRLTSALVAFALFEAAYYAEIMRAGILSVPRGQMNAGLALGLTRGQAMRSIILPQALRNMLPLLLTQAVILFQDTSLVYVIGLSDFFGTAYKVGDRDGRLMEMLLFAGGVYFVISFALSRLVARLQKRSKP